MKTQELKPKTQELIRGIKNKNYEKDIKKNIICGGVFISNIIWFVNFESNRWCFYDDTWAR